MGDQILIVDDAPAIVDTMRAALINLGVPEENIVTAGTAAEAMKKFNQLEPGIVFMDVQLPDSDGSKAALTILKVKPQTKVIVMSGLDRTDAKIRSVVSAGAYEVLEKPVRLDRLRDLLRLIDSETKGLRRVK